jgi:hypothetical protein
MRQTLALLLLLSFACASGSGQSGRTRNASTEDFDVAIEQANAPMTMPAHGSADLRFVITVKNRTAAPWTIERVALQSMGNGTFSIPVRTREFDRVLAPGAEEQLEFWATAELKDDPILARAPITMRATLTVKNDAGRRQEEFLQRINGRVSVAANKG